MRGATKISQLKPNTSRLQSQCAQVAIAAQKYRSSQSQILTIPQSIMRQPIMPDLTLLPSSDFKDLILLIHSYHKSYHILSGCLRLLRSPIGFGDSVAQQSPTAVLLADFKVLEQQRNDINTHYGWVLASDTALVGRIFGAEKDCEVGDVKAWLAGLCAEYEQVRDALDGQFEELRKLA
jgi:hypothetical protein